MNKKITIGTLITALTFVGAWIFSKKMKRNKIC